MPKTPQRSPIQQAVEIARRTKLLPTALSSKETANLVATLRHRAFWSARFTQVEALKGVQKLTERAIRGEGYENDMGQLRIEARKLLDTYGYTPEKGFPGDAALGIPAALPGTLRDLRSEQRLNLILNTQMALARGLGQQLRGLDRISAAPAWRLKRLSPRTAPREWDQRWAVAGDSVKWVGVYNAEDELWIARKDSPIWAALGSRDLFDDALNVSHPPFAFNTGMGWEEMLRSDLTGLRLVNDRRKVSDPEEEATTAEEAIQKMPEVQQAPEDPPEYVKPSDFIGGMTTIQRLIAKAKEVRKRLGL
ncbi:MAG: hypothetical protein V4662_24970 [Verrucomicrobiota bacterium]